jgi:NAD(P)-dependent dehydrogenase (short-subunit alcohol dehydrogenase family)
MTDPAGPTGKVAVITGGSRGIGRNTAVSLARQGVGVILTYVARQEDADSAVAEVELTGSRAVALQLDTGDIGDFEAFAAQVRLTLRQTWGRERFDFLVNNAGIGLRMPFIDTTEVMFDQLMNIHLKGVFFLTQTLLPLMEDGGRIVNVSSALARSTHPGASAYATMKGGVEVLTRYLAKELGKRSIAVNAVAPGAIETDFAGGAVRDNPDYNQGIANATAFGRVGVPEDVGPMIAALVSDENRWINGQRIEVSGGENL